MLTGQRDDESGAEEEETGRPLRNRTTRTEGYSGYEMDYGSEGGQSSGNEWQDGDDEEDNEFEGDDEGEVSGDESVVNGQPPSLVVQLRYGKNKDTSADTNGPGEEQPAPQPENATGATYNGGNQQQGPAASTVPQAPAESEFKMMQVDVPLTAEQQPRSLESAKEANGFANGSQEGSHFNAAPEAQISQPTAVHATNETG